MSKLINYSDEELLNLIRQSSSKALETLFARYFHRLCGFAYNFVKSTDLSEEVVSDIFLNIWLKRANLRIRSNFRAYLYSAVRNQSINYLKKNNRFFEQLEVVDKEEKIDELNAYGLIQYEELLNEIESIINKMPEKRRLIFRMSRFEGLKYREIAEILSISVNTVQNQMVEAVKFLANEYPKLKAKE